MAGKSDGYRTRIFISESSPYYQSLIDLGDTKVIRSRISHLIRLGWEYEQQVKEGTLILSTSPSQDSISALEPKKMHREVTKQRKIATTTKPKQEHINLPYKAPAGFVDQDFTF